MGSGASKKPAAAPAPASPSTSSSDATIVAPTPKKVTVSEPPKSSVASAPETNNGVPEYWYHNKTPDSLSFDDMFYQPEDVHGAFDGMFRDSYVASATRDRPCPSGEHSKTPGGCPCVQPGADPGLPVAFRVRRVIRVEAADMWRSYVRKRDEIRNRRSGDINSFDEPVKTMAAATAESNKSIFAPLDSSVNEVYAFHGTFVRYALSIAENDFNIDLAGSSTGTLYGRGAYLGESITKADEYARDEPDGYYEGVFSVLVCRVTMGKMNCTSSDPNAGEKVQRKEFDSTCGKRLFKELVIYYADQCYPEYLVLYQRVFKADVEEEMARVLKRKFFMQVPLHWRNVATDLTKTKFRDQPELSEAGRLHMQCLVNQACGRDPGREVVWCARLEDANLWERFVEFRKELRERLGGDEGLPAVSNDTDNKLKVNAVERDLRALMKRPCKFFKKGCRFGDKCRFSHNEFAADLTDLALAAGRRLPVDEMDRRLHEGFLWLACASEARAEELSSGTVKPHESLPGSCFYESLPDALKEVKSKDGQKFAILCRVICGVPGDDLDDADDKDCIILKVEDKRKHVLIKDSCAVYPEYFLRLHAEDFDEGEDEGEEEETKPLPRMDTEQLGPPEEEVDAVSDATFSAHVSAGGPSEHESLVDDDAEASLPLPASDPESESSIPLAKEDEMAGAEDKDASEVMSEEECGGGGGGSAEDELVGEFFVVSANFGCVEGESFSCWQDAMSWAKEMTGIFRVIMDANGKVCKTFEKSLGSRHLEQEMYEWWEINHE